MTPCSFLRTHKCLQAHRNSYFIHPSFTSQSCWRAGAQVCQSAFPPRVVPNQPAKHRLLPSTPASRPESRFFESPGRKRSGQSSSCASSTSTHRHVTLTAGGSPGFVRSHVRRQRHCRVVSSSNRTTVPGGCDGPPSWQSGGRNTQKLDGHGVSPSHDGGRTNVRGEDGGRVSAEAARTTAQASRRAMTTVHRRVGHRFTDPPRLPLARPRAWTSAIVQPFPLPCTVKIPPIAPPSGAPETRAAPAVRHHARSGGQHGATRAVRSRYRVRSPPWPAGRTCHVTVHLPVLGLQVALAREIAALPAASVPQSCAHLSSCPGHTGGRDTRIFSSAACAERRAFGAQHTGERGCS